VALRPGGIWLHLMKWIVLVPMVHLYPCARRPISSAQHLVLSCSSVLFIKSLYSTVLPVSGWTAWLQVSIHVPPEVLSWLVWASMMAAVAAMYCPLVPFCVGGGGVAATLRSGVWSF
jgi:hypothetical protein